MGSNVRLRSEPTTAPAEKAAAAALLMYFAAKAVFFALRIRERVFPDEATWVGVIRVYSRSWLPPGDSPATFSLGLVTHVPNLYFVIMGKLLALNPWPAYDLPYLRLLNALLGLATLWASWGLIRQLKTSPAVRLVFLVLMSNTMMFTFMAGAVSYDNLSTLLAVVALCLLNRFFKTRRLRVFLCFGVALCAGTLAKIVLLPYAAILLAVLLAREGGRAFAPGRRFFHGRGLDDPVNRLFFALLVLLAAWNVKLYGGNFIEFGRLVPEMQQVLPVESCLKFRLFARNYAVSQYRAGNLSLLDAQRLALQIRDPGDRDFALKMLSTAQREKSTGQKTARLGRRRYAGEWVQFMAARLYGVAAHLSLYKSDIWLYPVYALFALGMLMYIVRLGADSLALAGVGGFFLTAVSYALILMQVVNYKSYIASGFVGLALSGRYLFPVLAPLYAWLSYSLLHNLPRWWQWLMGVAVAGFFLYAEFPWFLSNAGPEWFAG